MDHVPGRRLAWLSLVSTKVEVEEWEMGCAGVGLGYSGIVESEGEGEESDGRRLGTMAWGRERERESRARAVEARVIRVDLICSQSTSVL